MKKILSLILLLIISLFMGDKTSENGLAVAHADTPATDCGSLCGCTSCDGASW